MKLAFVLLSSLLLLQGENSRNPAHIASMAAAPGALQHANRSFKLLIC